jgi:hypothetical protein
MPNFPSLLGFKKLKVLAAPGLIFVHEIANFWGFAII